MDFSTSFPLKRRTLLEFVRAHYVEVGGGEPDRENLAPLLLLKYHDSTPDAVADRGRPEETGKAFAGFQKLLYVRPTAA